MRIERATYGNAGGMHDLLASSLPRELLPKELYGRTDRPPGQLQSGVVWSPLVGCAPMGEWWALWRSWEDLSAGRGGMVRTQVMLVRHTDVGGLPDLSPLLNALTEGTPQTQPLLLEDLPSEGGPTGPMPAGFASLIHLLLNARRPIVIPDVPALETTIRALWPRLWPAARRALAARVAFDPDVLASQPETWWLVATPSAFATRWDRFPLVNRAETTTNLATEPEAWFFGQASLPFQSLMAELGDFSAEPNTPLRVARVLELARELEVASPSADKVVALLRELSQLSPQPGVASALKERTVATLLRQLPHAGPTAILGLANVAINLHSNAQNHLTEVVSRWVETRIPEVPDRDSLRLLQRTEEPGFEQWWVAAVLSGLKRALVRPSPSWVGALLRWWAQMPALLGTLEEALPASPEVESAIETALPTTLTPATGEALLEFSRRRGWSVLHGALLSRLRTPRKAIQEQRAFPGDPLPGLAKLDARLSAEDLVACAVEESWAPLVQAAAQRTRAQPDLLAALDPTVPGWQMLWVGHIKAGGDPWKGIRQPERIFRGLLDLVLQGEALQPSLLETLAATQPGHALHHPQRAKLWSVLPDRERNALLRSTTRSWLEGLAAGESLERPEDPLATEVLQSAESSLPSRVRALCLVYLFECFPEMGEDKALHWLNRLDRPLHRMEAERLGELIAKRRWQRTARHLFSMRQWTSDLDPLLQRCRDLLTFWEKLRLGGEARPNRSEALREVARLGATLYPDGPEPVWQRAGGAASDLERWGTGNDRWLRAVHQADRIHAVADLLSAMLEDYSRRAEIHELLQLFRR